MFRYFAGATVGLVLVTSLALAVPAAQGRAASARFCFGTVQVSPKSGSVGTTITVRGSHFTCTSPNGKLLPLASVMLSSARVGFRLYQVHVHAGGTYSRQIKLPATLIATSAISGGNKRNVKTRPGMYNLSVLVFDVHLPARNEILAKVRILA